MKHLFYTLRSRSFLSTLFFVSCLQGILARGYCQASSAAALSKPPTANQSSRGLSLFTLPPSVSVFRRDKDATAVLSRSIDAQGGKRLWDSYQSVRLDGSLHTKSSADGKVPLSLNYDWTDGLLRSRADMTVNGRRTVRTSRPEDGITEQSPGAMQSLAGRAHFSRFPAELPAVGASLALASPDEAITMVPLSSTDLKAVRVVRFSHHTAELETTQDWFFSLATGLPKYMIAYIPDSANRLLFRRHIYQYKSFQTTDGLTTPSELAIRSESHTRFLTIDSSAFGTSLPPSTFNVNAGGLQ